MKKQVVLGYIDFYNKTPPSDSFFFLRQYPSDIILLVLSRINAYVFLEDRNDFELLVKIFKQCFPYLSQDRKVRISALLRDNEQNNASLFFSPPAISKLLSICFSNFKSAENDQQIDEFKFQNDLWDNLLLVNYIYYKQLGEDDDVNSYISLFKLGMMQQYYIRRIDSYIVIGSIQVLLFHKFLKTRFENGSILIEEFLKKMNLTSFFDYARLSLEIVNKCIKGYKTENQAKWIITLNDAQMKIIEHFSYRPGHFANNQRNVTIHSDIMTHPFYFLLNKTPLVLDFDFISYMSEISLTFNFYHNTSLSKSDRFNKFKEFKGWLGKHYYEEYLAETILKGIFKEPRFKVLNDKQPFLPDFTIINNDKEIYLIEVKSVDISRKTLEENNGIAYQFFLDEQFASIKSEKNGNKGIYQLLSTINVLHNTSKLDHLFSKISRKKHCDIYPIILFTESALDIYGVSGYVQEKFEKETESYKNAFNKIYPVTLINMATLIERYSLLSENPFILKSWIKKFWKRNMSNYKSFKKDQDPNKFLRAGNFFTHFLTEIIEEDDREVNFRVITNELELKNSDK